MEEPTFVVDLAETMVVSGSTDSKGDCQKLYCNCGHTQVFKSKIKRNIVKNYDDLTEDSESLKSITCKECKTVYDLDKKITLLSPNKDELFNISYSLKKEEDKLTLIKTKSFANYLKDSDELTKKDVYDTLVIDFSNNKTHITIVPPFNSTDSLVSSGVSALNLDSTVTFDSIVDITNVSIFEEFFSFVDYIEYEGLEDAYSFLDIIQKEVKDLEKFKKISFLNFLISNNKIESELLSNGKTFYFQMIDSGFGDGSKVKKALASGDYLFNLMNSYKLFVSIISFPESANIILTKNYEFFQKWIESKFICLPDVYKKVDASNPNKIIEASLTYNKEGGLREEVIEGQKNEKEIENEGFLKISDTLYSAINSMDNLSVLLESYTHGTIKKNELEALIQKYESKRIFSLISKITSQQKRNNTHFNFKHFEHILKYSLDVQAGSNDLITTYADTLRVIGLLELKDSEIFRKCKDYDTLKALHDDYSSRYNVMKDSRKSEIFQKATEPHLKYNCKIGDVEIEVIPTTERLNLEGLQMHHCIYTYLNRICDREYLAINVNHAITKEKSTAGFTIRNNKLELEQLKGFYNSRASAEIINTVIEFCEKNNIKVNAGHTSDLQINKSNQRLMPGQMTEEDLFKLREAENLKNGKKKGEPKDKDGLVGKIKNALNF